MSVYFIRDENGLVKIGHARDPWRRLQDLQVAAPSALSIIRVVQGGAKVEAWFHKKFASAHVRGEWFWFSESMLTLMPPDEIPVVRKTQPAAPSRSIGDYLRDCDRLGLLTPLMREEYAPFLGSTQ